MRWALRAVISLPRKTGLIARWPWSFDHEGDRWQLLRLRFHRSLAAGRGAVAEQFDGTNGHDNMQRNKVTHRPRMSYASGYASSYACARVCKPLIHMDKHFFCDRFAFNLSPFSMMISLAEKVSMPKCGHVGRSRVINSMTVVLVSVAKRCR